jgi:hypothetical protein
MLWVCSFWKGIRLPSFYQSLGILRGGEGDVLTWQSLGIFEACLSEPTPFDSREGAAERWLPWVECLSLMDLPCASSFHDIKLELLGVQCFFLRSTQ